MSNHVEQVIAQRDDRPGQAAGELLECRVELSGVARVDHAEHRLGPRQVDPAGEERAERELARLGVARTAGSGSGPGPGSPAAASRPGGSRPSSGPCRCGAPARGPAAAGKSGRRPSTRKQPCAGHGTQRGGARSRWPNEVLERDPDRLGSREPDDAAHAGPGGLAMAAIVSSGSSATVIVAEPRSIGKSRHAVARCSCRSLLRQKTVSVSLALAWVCLGRDRSRGPCRRARRQLCGRSGPCGLPRGRAPRTGRTGRVAWPSLRCRRPV